MHPTRISSTLGLLALLAAVACGGPSPAEQVHGSWAPVEEADEENPTLVLTFEEGGVVTAEAGDREDRRSQGEYTVNDEGGYTLVFEQGEMAATLSENGDTLEVELRGQSGKMVRIDD